MSPINIAFRVGGLIVGLMAFIGFMNAVKGTPVDCVEQFGDGRPAAVDEPGFRTALELASRTPLHEGHDVEVFINGNETYPRLWADLRAARESITLQLYYCEPGRMADELREILVDRARAGVRIYEYRKTMMHAKTVVVDGLWSAVGSMNADNRSLSFNEATVLMMLDAGMGTTLERHFTDDIAHADEILLAEFRQRGSWDRLKEHVTHLAWRVL